MRELSKKLIIVHGEDHISKQAQFNATLLFNILLRYGKIFYGNCEYERSIARGAKVFPWAATTLVFIWTVIPIWKTRPEPVFFFFNSHDQLFVIFF